jgi:hypothetical protein
MIRIACLLLVTWSSLAGAETALAQEGSPSTASAAEACELETLLPSNQQEPPHTDLEMKFSSAELTNPSVGFGLSGITDYSPEQPFIDVMKTARPWLAHTEAQWGAWEHKDLAGEGYLDEQGWLKSVPPGAYAVESLFLTEMPAGAKSLAGRYRLTYDGSGEIEVNSMSQRWRGEKGGIWFEAVPGATIATVTITQTDPEGIGDYIRNISIVKEANIAAFEAGEMFNPTWLEHVRDARLVRFMDWMNTNNSTQSEWSERPKPSDYTYSLRGAPLEVMVNLANRIGADPWFNMPHLASDQYMRCFAQGVHQSLRTDLKAHVELSNEVWNWSFGQARWAEDSGMARWGQAEAWLQYYAVRSMDMARIWDSVYGSDADQRLVKIISSQTGWLGLEGYVLTPPLWQAENPDENIDTARFFDAYAVTGYFGFGLGDSKAPRVKTWIAESLKAATEESAAQGLSGAAQKAFIEQHRYDEAIEIAARDIKDGSVTGEKSGTLADYLENLLPYQAKIAQSYDLDLIMYEGGTHIVGTGPAMDDEDLTDFFIALNYSEQMGDLYRDLMAGWKSAGGTVFNVFVDVAGPSKWGSWGALRHLDDENSRWDAIARFNQSEPGWWEERAQGSFVARR